MPRKILSADELRRYWPWARIELGMRRSEFDRLTLGEFNSLRRYWLARRKTEARERGELLYVIASTGGATTAAGEPIGPEHFVPKWARARRRVRTVPLVEQFLRTLQACNIPVERKN